MKKGSVSGGLVFHAGFPNAAEDQISGQGLSLDSLVFRHRASTYLWRLESAVSEMGWGSGSLVVVDRALNARQGDLVVAIVDEAFVIRKLHQGKLFDLHGNLDTTEASVEVWGVITHALQEYRTI